MPRKGFLRITWSRISGPHYKTYCSTEDMIMHTFDLSPLFRTSVGFDRLNHLFDAALRVDDGTSFPPYNIEKLDEESQRIIFKRFYESKTTKEIGKENGYGRETARRRIIDAVDKLKQLCLPS